MPRQRWAPASPSVVHDVKIFLCGDVMTGRGIDQILPHPGSAQIHEPFMRSAQGYVELAEESSGPIARPVGFEYIWGDALDVLAREDPDARIVNLETAITVSNEAWPGKGIHYRMHPDNAGCLTAARVDCCSLANNHVLDWGYPGLLSTLAALRAAGIHAAGAGPTEAAAAAPAILELGRGSRILVFALASQTAGVPREWAAADDRPGVNLLRDLSPEAAAAVGRQVEAVKRPGDVVVVSLHWGPNWGYEVTPTRREFAHRLVDDAHVDIVHGHSSHHPIGIEVHRDRLIVYGCGDFINDYEGIRGYDTYRPDLTAAYFATLDATTGRLQALELAPMRIRGLHLNRASAAEAGSLARALTEAGRGLGTEIAVADDLRLRVRWR